MGSCVSVHRDPEKLRLSVESKDEKLLIPSPVKQKSDKVNGGDLTVADVALKSPLSPSRFRNAGSKEEAFFDSQPWLESDCEDDYFSVNGDFTPSSGSTPIHHKFSSGKPQMSTTGLVEPSPDKRKRLSELFKESLSTGTDEENTAKAEVFSEKQNGVVKTEGKPMKSVQCCLPRLRSSRSFSERRKKMSPAHSIG